MGGTYALEDWPCFEAPGSSLLSFLRSYLCLQLLQSSFVTPARTTNCPLGYCCVLPSLMQVKTSRKRFVKQRVARGTTEPSKRCSRLRHKTPVCDSRRVFAYLRPSRLKGCGAVCAFRPIEDTTCSKGYGSSMKLPKPAISGCSFRASLCFRGQRDETNMVGSRCVDSRSSW